MKRRKSPLRRALVGLAWLVAVSPLRVIAAPEPPARWAEVSWFGQLVDLVQGGIESLRAAVDKLGATFDPHGLNDPDPDPDANPKPTPSGQR